LTGVSKAVDGSSQAIDVEEEGLKKAGSRRSEIDMEVDQELWTWYQKQQTKGRKPSWHEVGICSTDTSNLPYVSYKSQLTNGAVQYCI
jgi:hypothetical protein